MTDTFTCQELLIKQLKIPLDELLYLCTAFLAMKAFIMLIKYLFADGSDAPGPSDASCQKSPGGSPGPSDLGPKVRGFLSEVSKADRSFFEGILNNEDLDAKAETLTLEDCLLNNSKVLRFSMRDLDGIRIENGKIWNSDYAELDVEKCIQFAEKGTSPNREAQQALEHFRYEEPNGIQKLAAIRAWTCTDLNYFVSSRMREAVELHQDEMVEKVRPVLPYLRLLYSGLHALGNLDPGHFIYRGPMYRGEKGHHKTPHAGDQVLFYCATSFSKNPQVALSFSGRSFLWRAPQRTLYEVQEGCGYDISGLSEFAEDEVLAEGVLVLWAESGTGFHTKVLDMYFPDQKSTKGSAQGLQIVKTRLGEGYGMLRNSPLRDVERRIVSKECAEKVEQIMRDKSYRDALSASMKICYGASLESYHRLITNGIQSQHDIQPVGEKTRMILRDLSTSSSNPDDNDQDEATYEECLPCLIIAQQSLLCIRGGTVPIRSRIGSGHDRLRSLRMKSFGALNAAADGWSLVWRDLRSASIQNMGLQSVPDRMLKLRHLTALDLGGNPLKRIPLGLQDEIRLTTLRLDADKLLWPEIIESGKDFFSPSPRGFLSLQKLTLLYSAKDPDPMPEEAVNEAAQWLDKVGSSKGGLTMLSIKIEDAFDQRGFSGAITARLSESLSVSGGVLTNLQTLHLSNLKPKLHKVPDWLEALSLLKELDISNNAISSLPDARPKSISASLGTLNVTGNVGLGYIGGLEKLSCYAALTNLCADYVFTKHESDSTDSGGHVNADFISQLTCLKALSLRFNSKFLLELPPLGLLPLQSLDLTKCKTRYPPKGLLTVLSSLRILKMGMGGAAVHDSSNCEQNPENEISAPQQSIFLRTAHLDGCGITSIPSWLWNSSALTDLKLSHDKLGPSMKAPLVRPPLSRSLTKLCLFALGLKAVPSWVSECDMLRELQLGGSNTKPENNWPLEPLQELPDTICRLSCLTKLSIRRSTLRCLPRSDFSKLQALSELDVGRNPNLKKLPLGLAFCKRLTKLVIKEKSDSLENTFPTFPPISVWTSEEDLAQRVKRYMSLVIEGKVQVNLVKVVMVGNQGAGKTVTLNGLFPQNPIGGTLLPRASQNSECVCCSRIGLDPTLWINGYDIGSKVAQEHQRIAAAFGSVYIVAVSCSAEEIERRHALCTGLDQVRKWAPPRSAVLVVPTHPDLYGKGKKGDVLRKKTLGQLKSKQAELAANAAVWSQGLVDELRELERKFEIHMEAEWHDLRSRRDQYFDVVERHAKEMSQPMRLEKGRKETTGGDNLKMAEMLLDAMSKIHDAMSKVQGQELGKEDFKLLDEKVLNVLGRPTIKVVQNPDDLHGDLLTLAKRQLGSLSSNDYPAPEVLLLERELRFAVQPNVEGGEAALGSSFEWDPQVDSLASQQPKVVCRLKEACITGSRSGRVESSLLRDAWSECEEDWNRSESGRQWYDFDTALKWLASTGCIVQSEGHVILPAPGGDEAGARALISRKSRSGLGTGVDNSTWEGPAWTREVRNLYLPETFPSMLAKRA